MNVWYVNSILGTFRLEEENDAICGLTLCPDGVPELEPLPRKVCETPLLQEAEEQLNEYFAGARREFDLPLAPKGTPFQKAVWAEMNKIPYGEVRTYGQLAAALGKPKAARAVGGACHCNPIAIIQPCHRVVGAGGKLTGYAGGLEMKRALLDEIPEGKVSLENECIPRWMQEGRRLGGIVNDGYFIDIGVPEDYFRFQENVRKGDITW